MLIDDMTMYSSEALFKCKRNESLVDHTLYFRANTKVGGYAALN